MSKLEQLRAKLREEDSNKNSGGDKAVFLFWDMPEGSTTTLRFLPDKDEKNIYFWKEKQVIKLEFAGIKGQPNSSKVVVQVPCNELWNGVDSCPIHAEIRKWFKTELEPLARKYWKKRTYLYQGFVVNSSLVEKDAPENPIRRFIIGSGIHKNIEHSLMAADSEFEEMPCDYNNGHDFKVAKNKKGEFFDYSASTWSLKERALNENELASIDKFGLPNLSDFLPKEPDAESLVAISEMFKASIDGEPYDPDRWGKFYKAPMMNNASTSTTTVGAAPVAQVTPTVAQVTPTVAQVTPAVTPETVAKIVAETMAPAVAETVTPVVAPAADDGPDKSRAHAILKQIQNRPAP